MGSWFKRTKNNGLTVTQSSKGTTWSKSTKGGSVRYTITNKPNGKIIQTTTHSAPGGLVKIDRKTVNKTPRLPRKPKVVKLPRSRTTSYSRNTNTTPTSLFSLCCLLVLIIVLSQCQG